MSHLKSKSPFVTKPHVFVPKLYQSNVDIVHEDKTQRPRASARHAEMLLVLVKGAKMATCESGKNKWVELVCLDKTRRAQEKKYQRQPGRRRNSEHNCMTVQQRQQKTEETKCTDTIHFSLFIFRFQYWYSRSLRNSGLERWIGEKRISNA